jgi:uroporphyrin-III C-methyltransferase
MSETNSSPDPADFDPPRSIQKTPRGLRTRVYALAAFALLGVALIWLVDRTPQSAPLSQATPANVSNPAMEARLSDVQQVNRVLREQTLALTQRVELLEQSLSGLRRSRAPGAESFKLDEAQYLLSMAQTRIELFSDAEGALKAMQLADQLMANAADPSLNAIRQSLAVEMDAVRASPTNDVRTLNTKLRALKDQLSTLPVKIDAQITDRGRMMSALDRYLVVRREGEAMPILGRSAWAVREGMEIEFERAQLALERQNDSDWQNALSAARNMAERGLQNNDEVSVRFLSELTALLDIGLAPKPPTIGASMRELMRLRETTQPLQDTMDPLPLIPESTPQATPATPKEPAEAIGPNDAPATPVPPALS